MNFYIIIPAHNEEAHLQDTLISLCNQSLLPKKIMVVNDHSTDSTQEIIDGFVKEFSFIDSITIKSSQEALPGSKIINAFSQGLLKLDNLYDVICKFDADLIFPKNYLETLSHHFSKNTNYGMVGGFCYIYKNGNWELENLTNKDHIRGALKAYKKDCFQQIGGLQKAMGWDTVDELLAQFYGWKIMTDETLHVKHLKPTGSNYSTTAAKKQGGAFKNMRYGFILTLIGSMKLAYRKKSPRYFFGSMYGYFTTQTNYLVNPKEGRFIRKLRWKNMKKRFF